MFEKHNREIGSRPGTSTIPPNSPSSKIVVIRDDEHSVALACTAAELCESDSSFQQYDETGIIALFAGADAIGCENEASNFRLAWIINP